MLRLLILAVFALVAYLLLWPVPIEPVAWNAPEAPELAGPFAPNNDLGATIRIELDDGAGPEDIAVDAAGNVYGGLLDGRIARRPIADSAADWETFADTGGRPLGFAFDDQGRLVVADATKGLLRIDADGAIEVLATEHGGRPFAFADDVDIGPDGVIYFTDASDRFTFTNWKDDALEHRPRARLLAYDPRTSEVELLIDRMVFANGVAVAEDGSFLLVNETWEYRVQRYWLTGPRAGEHEIFLDNLPGFPDGISRGSDGIYWIALASTRDELLDKLADKPWLRKVIRRLPPFLHPKPKRYGFVLGVDAAGTIRHNLQAPDPAPYAPITSVEEVDGVLWLGSLSEPAIGHIPRP